MVFNLTGSILKDIGDTSTTTGTASKIINAGVQTGESTRAITRNIENIVKVNAATAGLPASVQNITANFNAIGDVLKNITSSISGSETANAPGAKGGPNTNTSADSTNSSAGVSTDSIIESLDQFKTFLGPIGIGAVLLFALLAVRK